MMKGFFNYDELTKFIGLVKQHPVLYDPSAKNSGGRSTADVWAKITTEMNIPSMQIADWKSKWKCLRDTFVKKKKDTRLADSQVAVDKATQWRFFDHMTFLDQFVDKSRFKPVPRSNGSDYQHYTIIKREYPEGDSAEEEGTEAASNDKHPSSEPVNTNAPNPAKRGRYDADEEEMNEDDEEDEEDEDGDDDTQWNVEGGNSRSFFMSCAFRMDRLPERVQSYLQLQVSQLFFNAENPEVPPVPIMPLPPRTSSTVPSRPK